RTRRTVKLLFYKSAQDSPAVKVGLAKNLHKFSFRSGGDFTVTDGYREFTGTKDKFYTFTYKKKSILLMDYESGAVYKKFAPSVTMKTNGYPFYVLDVVYGKSNFWHKEIDRMYRGTLHVIAGNGTITLINVLSMEEYLYGVVPSEIPATSPPEALRAQAIAARTIALKSMGKHKKEGFDVCSQVHCQAYQGMSAEKPATNAAVDETRGEIVVDNEKEKPIEALYHANCGGCLRSDVFGKSSYLRNQLDSPKSIQKEGESVFLHAYGQERWMYDEPVAFCGYPKSSFRWQRVYDGEDFFLAFGFSLKNVKSIVPLKKGECGHYDSAKVTTSGGENTLSGDLRIRDYFDKLRSSAFRVEVKFSANKEAQMLLFWGAGFGHAAGVCQEGAMGMASQGYTYDEILRHYYPNTKIKTAY
ncbi:MAG: SpoIID/LytB domain-containing protein, partial [Candidatus Omnitrophica bacterium]|nr:SpoIID/LytB domain-containing protein [Candidatus Omnitrophota bacterium]